MALPVTLIVLGIPYLFIQEYVVFVGLSVLLSSLFESEYTAFIFGMCAIATAFFAFKARSIHR